MDTTKHKKKAFFDLKIACFDHKTIIDEILLCISKSRKTIFLGLNADCFNISRKNRRYNEILKCENNYIYPDGMSIVWAQFFLNKILQERIVTTDLILYFLTRLSNVKNNITITFMGGSDGAAEKAKNNLNEKFKVNSIKYAIEPPYISLEEISDPNSPIIEDLIVYLNNHPTDVLFVGLGCPKQEILCDRILHRIPHKVLLPCGGLFNYYSGKYRRAPNWMQKIGMEWFFRLLLEPSRLWKRYLLGNFIFIFYVIFEKIKLIYQNMSLRNK